MKLFSERFLSHRHLNRNGFPSASVETTTVEAKVGHNTRRTEVRTSGIQRTHAVFVTNFCPHYRVKTFETFARDQNIDFVFCSAGEEWYWQQQHGVRVGNFSYEYLPAIRLTRRVRLVPALITRLWRKNYDVYIKCINGRFALPITYLTAKLRRKPFVLWTGIWMTLDTRFHRLIFPLTLWIYRHADAIVAYGEHVKRYLMGLKIAPEKIFIAPHAMDNSMYDSDVPEDHKAALRAKLTIGADKVIMYLGRLEKVKGIEYLLKAFASLSTENATLVIVGDGSLREGLVELAVELGIASKTRFAGYASPEDALSYYAIADLFVLPSITTPQGRETWGLVVNEAMNQGVPVVATDAVGAAAGGLVQSGVNGFVVPERNSTALAEAMRRILSNEELRNRMSRNARRIIAGWNNERMVQGFEQAVHYALSVAHKKAARMTYGNDYPTHGVS